MENRMSLSRDDLVAIRAIIREEVARNTNSRPLSDELGTLPGEKEEPACDNEESESMVPINENRSGESSLSVPEAKAIAALTRLRQKEKRMLSSPGSNAAPKNARAKSGR